MTGRHSGESAIRLLRNVFGAAGELKRNMHHRTLPLGRAVELTFLEQLQHRPILCQNLRNEFLEPGAVGKRDEMTEECAADALSLIVVDDGKRDFGYSRLNDDIASAANDDGLAFFFNCRDKGDVIDEIYVQKKFDFFFRNAPFGAENRRYSDCALVRSTALRSPGRSSGRSERISIRRPSRRASTAEYVAALVIAHFLEHGSTAAVLPILPYIAVVIDVQAFQTTPDNRHLLWSWQLFRKSSNRPRPKLTGALFGGAVRSDHWDQHPSKTMMTCSAPCLTQSCRRLCSTCSYRSSLSHCA